MSQRSTDRVYAVKSTLFLRTWKSEGSRIDQPACGCGVEDNDDCLTRSLISLCSDDQRGISFASFHSYRQDEYLSLVDSSFVPRTNLPRFPNQIRIAFDQLHKRFAGQSTAGPIHSYAEPYTEWICLCALRSIETDQWTAARPSVQQRPCELMHSFSGGSPRQCDEHLPGISYDYDVIVQQ